ncbi:MAG: Mov34/MPN/PAD-1 family protein [Motiliproteus sp.]|nr:Mov34/MPN/PAD-1 family protein [Motiliproteus sp.]
MQQIVLGLPQGGFLLIEPNIIETLYNFRQLDDRASEAGGIIVGEYREEHVRITELSAPGNLDVQKRSRFYRCSPHHQSYAFQCWRDSGGLKTWVGEWHTHPEDYPNPSNIDRSSWRKNLPNRIMVLIIQGRVGRWYGIWTGKEVLEIEG